MLQRILSYAWPVLVLGTAFYLMYRVEGSKKSTKQKVIVVQDIPRPPKEPLPIIRIHSYKPNPTHITSWVQDNPSWTVLPNKLQWWEKKEPCQLAEALVAKDALGSLHIFLGQQILAVKKKCVSETSTSSCMNKWLDTRAAVDEHLKEFISPVIGREMTWVAVTMMYSGNLEAFHNVVGQQALKLRKCGKKPLCIRKVVRALDVFFKKIVVDHGGPFIDRNWTTQ